MSFGGGGQYGIPTQGGGSLPLNPQLSQMLYLQPLLQSLISQAAGSNPGQFFNQQGNPLYSSIMNFANSAAANPRPISPTIPGLNLPSNIMAILQAPGQNKAQLASNLTQASPGGSISASSASPTAPTVSGSPTGGSPSVPTGGGQQPTLSQVVQQAVMAAMAEAGGSGGTGGGQATETSNQASADTANASSNSSGGAP